MTNKILLSCFLVLSCSCEQKIVDPGALYSQYLINDITADRDTISLGDTTGAGVGLELDCTNKVTRIDVSIAPFKATVAVYGTIWTGPGPRPLCPAHFVKQNVSFTLPYKGTWIIQASEPPGNRQLLQDTVVVY